jgi:hypothetical protein
VQLAVDPKGEEDGGETGEQPKDEVELGSKVFVG